MGLEIGGVVWHQSNRGIDHISSAKKEQPYSLARMSSVVKAIAVAVPTRPASSWCTKSSTRDIFLPSTKQSAARSVLAPVISQFPLSVIYTATAAAQCKCASEKETLSVMPAVCVCVCVHAWYIPRSTTCINDLERFTI